MGYKVIKMQIYKFNDILKPVLWGGSKLAAFKHLAPSSEPIGESWELSAVPGHESVVASEGEDCGLTLTQLVQRHGAALVGDEVYRAFGDKFPLLIKFIDAKQDLSLQVHPDDAMAAREHGASGKTEMWYVVDSEDDAVIRTGFNRGLSPEEYERRVGDNTILDVVNATPTKPGDTFFIPAGQIHSIGAGNLIAEVQQSSDITYRVYDYGRRDADGNLRELHTRQACEALNFDASNSKVDLVTAAGPGVTPLVKCPKFDVRRLDFGNGYTLDLPQPHNFVVLMCLNGETTVTADEEIGSASLLRGVTVLVPATATRITLTGKARLLLVTM